MALKVLASSRELKMYRLSGDVVYLVKILLGKPVKADVRGRVFKSPPPPFLAMKEKTK